MSNNGTNNKKISLLSVRGMTVIALLSTVAVLLMFLEVPLWFAPSFYKIDFSEVPVLIGAFALGPVAGVVIEFLKIAINLFLEGSDSALVGELANFLLGCALVVPAAAIYYKGKNRKSAIIGLSIGTVVLVIVGSLLNAFLLLPFYARVYIPMETIINMGRAINPNITSVTTMVLYAVTPFNLLKGILVSLITILIYKRVSFIIKGYH
ncbi:ECF transporter S component [Mobilitalea sibirica]|uniref:Riboflavin transporter n=2 Tax=Mobilitalea sibirica TaxID=1462919 RepID=A0A8J7HEI7_9FIRM|nr:ECF transporter S component [Mobilitalea sibirica]